MGWGEGKDAGGGKRIRKVVVAAVLMALPPVAM